MRIPVKAHRGFNAGGRNTVEFLRYSSNIPCAVGQLVTDQTNHYVVTATGSAKDADGNVQLGVRQITALAASSIIDLQGVTIVNNAVTIDALTIP